MKKDGVSPMIATVLLIVIVIVIALIIFLWIRGLSEETITKFGGQNIKIVCGDVRFEASYSDGVLSIRNNGNVPIYDMNLKVSSEGNYEKKELSSFSNKWPSSGLNQGGTFSDSVSLSGDEIALTPILVGESEGGKRVYNCGDEQYILR